jgi:predicted transcriptional regulator
MAYVPNFTDPRVKSRATRALGFASGVMSTTKSHAWSSRYIDRYFGVSSNPLSRYLRELLLICTDDFYVFNSPRNKCKEYRLNSAGVRILSEHLKSSNTTTYPSVLQVVRDDHAGELSTGNFAYKDQSNRLWHPLQRYRKQHKQQILQDYNYTHQYDIECCAPTLILQASQQAGMDLWLAAMSEYLDHKRAVREQLAQELELDVSAVKEVINALFAGAVISRNTESDIYHILAGDVARIEFLKENEFIQQLKQDIKTCWEYLRPAMQKRTRTTAKGTERLLPVTSKQKWHLYFELERRAMDSVRTYLDLTGNRYFLEHDGWTCENPCDVDCLRIHVLNETGFDLKFEYQNLAIL